MHPSVRCAPTLPAVPAVPAVQFMFRDRSPGSPLKAIDFGISVFCQPGQYVDVRAGTPIYIAPDVSHCWCWPWCWALVLS